MKLIYEYEDSMRQCETLLNENFTKLLTYSKCKEPSLSQCSEKDDMYSIIKYSLDTIQENIVTLKTEYDDLTHRYKSLLADKCVEEFLNYLNCQESLRLKFIELIERCKCINSCLDDLCRISVEKLNENSSECFRVTCNNRWKVLFKSHPASQPDTPPPQLDQDQDDDDDNSVPDPNYISSTHPTLLECLSRDFDDNTTTVTENCSTSFPAIQKGEEFKESFTSTHPILLEYLSRDVGDDTATTVTENYSTSFSEIQKVQEVKELVSSEQNEILNIEPSISNIPLKCAKCGQLFVEEDFLNQHILEHEHEPNPEYMCSVCGDLFHKKREMLEHELQHVSENVSKYSASCKYCESKSPLPTHRRTDNCYFYCSYCNRRFSFKNQLVNHVKKHLLMSFRKNRKIHRCTFCSATFTTVWARKTHREKNCHGVRRCYCCMICGNRYKFDSDLEKHLEKGFCTLK
ncbi:zinc finger and SCAN domain-containing protein 2-like isoform X2 [Planococcus citri]|uniref:zinc finger and SCAN domain-containing protein 2-like isoform X2 n=1 Tax=Planococcus citri TaxID=170843 RepID=UPI0031F972F9